MNLSGLRIRKILKLSNQMAERMDLKRDFIPERKNLSSFDVAT
jgi:hypothetical protein